MPSRSQANRPFADQAATQALIAPNVYYVKCGRALDGFPLSASGVGSLSVLPAFTSGTFGAAHLLIALVVAAFAGLVWAESNKEQDIKLAYLLNFARYATWPQMPVNQIELCVFRNDELTRRLFDVSRNRTIHALPINATNVHSEDDINRCHLVYFPAHKDAVEALDMYTAMSTKPILAVGETQKFSERNGSIRFLLKDNAVRFEVNLNTVRANGMDLSSRLLQHAYAVLTTAGDKQ